MNPTPYLDALEDLFEARRSPVESEGARAAMRAALAPEQLAVLDDPSRFIIERTARGAGKTAVMVSDALDEMSTIPGWRGCYGSLSVDSGLEAVWDELKRQNAIYGFGLKFAEHAATAIHPGTGGRLRLRGIDTKRAVDRWRGKQYHKIYIDELQSIDNGVLSYAIVQVLPPTLSRFHGGIMAGGTPRMDCSGWWHSVSGPPGLEAERVADGSVRAQSRPWAQRNDQRWESVQWTWSVHTWPRSSNPGLSDADRETDSMRRALATTQAELDALNMELGGEWPKKEVDALGRMVRFDPVRNTWNAGPVERNYDLPPGHTWLFVLGADLAIKWDRFALELGAYASTSKKAYHCDEFVGLPGFSIKGMAGEFVRFIRMLGPRLVAIVGDTQGPTGSHIFDELQRVHSIPIEKAKKGGKDDAVALISSDLDAEDMFIKAGSVLAQQMKSLRRPDPTKPVSRHRGQPDDAFDAWLYTRRRMLHGFGKDEAAPPSPEQVQDAERRRQLRAMRARQVGDPLATIRGLGEKSW